MLTGPWPSSYLLLQIPGHLLPCHTTPLATFIEYRHSALLAHHTLEVSEFPLRHTDALWFLEQLRYFLLQYLL